MAETCPACGTVLEVTLSYGAIGDKVTCPSCHQTYEVAYDESYNADTGDEYGWFWLEVVAP